MATLDSQRRGPWWAPAPPNRGGVSQTLPKTPSAETKQGRSEVTTCDLERSCLQSGQR